MLEQLTHVNEKRHRRCGRKPKNKPYTRLPDDRLPVSTLETAPTVTTIPINVLANNEIHNTFPTAEQCYKKKKTHCAMHLSPLPACTTYTLTFFTKVNRGPLAPPSRHRPVP